MGSHATLETSAPSGLTALTSFCRATWRSLARCPRRPFRRAAFYSARTDATTALQAGLTTGIAASRAESNLARIGNRRARFGRNLRQLQVRRIWNAIGARWNARRDRRYAGSAVGRVPAGLARRGPAITSGTRTASGLPTGIAAAGTGAGSGSHPSAGTSPGPRFGALRPLASRCALPAGSWTSPVLTGTWALARGCAAIAS